MAMRHHNEHGLTGLWMKSLVVVAFAGAALFGAYEYGRHEASNRLQGAQLAELEAQLSESRAELREMHRRMEAEMDALALRLGSLRAHVLRLDALGERLVRKGKLDAEEFDFRNEPPLGGLDDELLDAQDGFDLRRELERLERSLKDREHKLELLEELLMQRELEAQVTLSGRPVKKGWISSGFGRRTDPFTGKKKFHRGIDFAGKAGSEVLAVAAGVVIASRWEKGYGNIVEIRHADGYVTHYAHNRENLVKVGDRVEKGETIAIMGSTGRSSGPHVHFEVRRNGKIVDPARFIDRG